ncbi:MAG: hypothetical protein A3G87_06820 [Omnitrophica bacterium RIFCSPLOWO2_12_FULL_50_11]|nr:MAG: hypothetical protein A3G87_06820 [Omnitrophica bacterium RIFCSPLOWO2_12_FULL_50_11]
MILILVLFVFFLLAAVIFWARGNKRWAFVVCIPAVLIILFAGYFVDYYSPRHWIEIKLPIDLSDMRSTQAVEFVLPKKEYILTAFVKDISYEKGNTALLKYALEIPAQNLKIENERKMDFSGIDGMMIESFKIEKHRTKGRLNAEVRKAGSGSIFLTVRTDRALDM